MKGIVEWALQGKLGEVEIECSFHGSLRFEPEKLKPYRFIEIRF